MIINLLLAALLTLTCEYNAEVIQIDLLLHIDRHKHRQIRWIDVIGPQMAILSIPRVWNGDVHIDDFVVSQLV